MFGDEDDDTVFDRLWSMMIGDKFAYLVPLWIINRPETLTVLDYRPTFAMLLTGIGVLLLLVSFVFLFFGMDFDIVSGLWALAIPGLVCIFLLFRGTVREVYSFDRVSDSYSFVRQFIHRK